jgi:hypothetical protein
VHWNGLAKSEITPAEGNVSELFRSTILFFLRCITCQSSGGCYSGLLEIDIAAARFLAAGRNDADAQIVVARRAWWRRLLAANAADASHIAMLDDDAEWCALDALGLWRAVQLAFQAFYPPQYDVRTTLSFLRTSLQCRDAFLRLGQLHRCLCRSLLPIGEWQRAQFGQLVREGHLVAWIHVVRISIAERTLERMADRPAGVLGLAEGSRIDKRLLITFPRTSAAADRSNRKCPFASPSRRWPPSFPLAAPMTAVVAIRL